MGSQHYNDESIREARAVITEYLRKEKRSRVVERAALMFPNIPSRFFETTANRADVSFSTAKVDGAFRFIRAVEEAMRSPKVEFQTIEAFRDRHMELRSMGVTKGRAIWICSVQLRQVPLEECVVALKQSHLHRGEEFKYSSVNDIAKARDAVRLIDRIRSEEDFEVNPIRLLNPYQRH